MGCTRHLSCHPNKRVIVKLKDGSKFFDKFLRRHERYIWLESYGKVRAGLVQSIMIFKGDPKAVKL